MISQTDATNIDGTKATEKIIATSTTTTTTTNTTTNHNFCHPSKSPISNSSADTTNSSNNPLHNGKNSKGFCNISKKRKRYEEVIIDGFAISAFKTWEDLQDELNERSSLSNNNNNNNNNNNSNSNSNSNNNNNISTSNDNSISNNIHETADKKVNPKSKQKSSSTSATNTNDSSDNTNILNNASNSHNQSQLKDAGARKKDKSKKKAEVANSQLSINCNQDKQRNKTSSEKTTLKRALEAKDLAEKRLSILQEKLKQEQIKNQNNHHDTKTNISEHYQGPMQTSQINNATEQLHSRSSNGLLGHDLLREPNPVPTRATPYSPFHVNSNLQRPSSYNANPHPMQQLNNPPASPRNNHQHIKHPSQLMQPHPQSPPMGPPPQAQSNPHHQPPPPPQLSQTPLIPPQIPHSIHQSHPQYLPRAPHHSAPQPPLQTHPHLIPPPPPHHQQPSMHPYSSHPPNSMMSSMGLGALPSPYSCPPSIYITDTISRQTSIIPPPIAPALEQTTTHTQASRFGHSSVLQSITPYNLTPHHPMYYPTLPTERSFIEFARSYTGPGHLGYSNLMNPYPTPSPSASITANPYSFDRWPRVAALDHQRAVSRYNSLYQSTTALPDRAYPASYAGTRPPSFPAGLFPPPF